MISNTSSVFSLRDNLASFRTKSEIIKIVYIYRYASWFLTSLFYIIGPPKSPLLIKVGVVVSLFFAARITTSLYIKFSTSLNMVKTLVFIETIGITLLLIPTGGLDSPFIWYALNPALIAASFLSAYFCWFNLIFYILSAALTSYLVFNNGQPAFIKLLYDNSYAILILILVTLAVQLLSRLARQLTQQASELQKQREELLLVNSKLQEANTRLEDSMEHIMSLYQVVESFNTRDNPDNLPQTFADYAVKLTKTCLSFFWLAPGEERYSFTVFGGESGEDIKMELIQRVESMWEGPGHRNVPVKLRVTERNFLAVAVKSSSRHYGLLGIEVTGAALDDLNSLHVRQLTLLSELCSVILERFNMVEIAEHLMIIEEQNRIANEMHDSISQRLFNIVCSIHAVTARLKNMHKEELGKQLDMIKETANASMKEMRSTIYRLSSKKKGEKALFTSIETYLESVSSLNSITVELNLIGDEMLLCFSLKKALYRIICEAAGNSMRHGRCNMLKVLLEVGSSNIRLNIKDNGQGFCPNSLSNKSLGLGIFNMRSLAQSFQGTFEINSEIGKGTEINIIIPIAQIANDVQGGIV